MENESLTIEYKREYTDEIKKTIIAFANTRGGELLIGVADDGAICGVADADDTMLRVTNVSRDTIRPDITGFMQCEERKIRDKSIIAVSVQKGTARPYYLASEGIRPEGVYVRQGSSTVPATERMILKMIKETGGDDYEITRSLVQAQTFISTEKYFVEEKLRFGKEQKRTLGMIGEDDAFTNLGLLLSDQCTHSIKMAVFEGSVKTIFKDRAEFSGSLLSQLDAAYAFIDRYNRTRSEFPGLKRVDMRDYPPEAVREALLNAIVHRDYSYSGPTLISIFDDRIEFLTLGGLPKGISMSDIMMGASMPRNKRLADIFYRLHLIEAYGTGIQKIMECYRGYRQQPSIETSENAFKIRLPNTNYVSEDTAGENRLLPEERQILEHIAGNGQSTRAEIEAEAGISQSGTIRILKKLLEYGLIMKQGNGKNTSYSAL